MEVLIKEETNTIIKKIFIKYKMKQYLQKMVNFHLYLMRNLF